MLISKANHFFRLSFLRLLIHPRLMDFFIEKSQGDFSPLAVWLDVVLDYLEIRIFQTSNHVLKNKERKRLVYQLIFRKKNISLVQ